jgi:hypothetical protein
MIVGWQRFVSILGFKTDECSNCGVIGRHALVRKTWWFDIFFIPIVLLRFQHGMVCTQCGAWTGIPFLELRRGLKSGKLPLARPRPKFEQLPPDEWGARPDPATLDVVTPNPSPGLMNWYVRVWPFLAVGLVALVIVYGMLNPTPKTPDGQVIDKQLQDRYGQAHDCWVDSTGSHGAVLGCKMHDGEMVGDSDGIKTVCYFAEADLASLEKIRCND